MDKLTKRTPEGIAYLAKVRVNEQEIEASKNTCECLFESWQRLADYEDAAPLSKVQEWAKAEAEGRLVELHRDKKISYLVEIKGCTGCKHEKENSLRVRQDFCWNCVHGILHVDHYAREEAEEALKEGTP